MTTERVVITPADIIVREMTFENAMSHDNYRAALFILKHELDELKEKCKRHGIL